MLTFLSLSGLQLKGLERATLCCYMPNIAEVTARVKTASVRLAQPEGDEAGIRSPRARDSTAAAMASGSRWSITRSREVFRYWTIS